MKRSVVFKLILAGSCSFVGLCGCEKKPAPPAAGAKSNAPGEKKAGAIPVDKGPQLGPANDKATQTPAAKSAEPSEKAAPAPPAEPAKEAPKNEAPKTEAASPAAPTATAKEEKKDANAPKEEKKEAAAHAKKEQLPTEKIAEAAKPAAEEEVLLGIDDLTKGIPGDGALTTEQIKKWLDDPKNQAVLKPTLPQGLAMGAGQIAGVDKNPLTRAKIELGRQLYFDGRLSKDGTISCGSCHAPEFGYAKNTQFGIGVGGQQGGRNSPVAYNRIVSSLQFWDGRADSLEAQAVGPIANPIEMSNTHEACVATIKGIDGYRLQFEKVFPDGVTIDNVGKAIASFERSLVTGTSPWDYYEAFKTFSDANKEDLADLAALKKDDPELFAKYESLKKAADEHPISDSAKRGGEIFFGDKGSCTACHVGANFTDEKYHNLGVGMEKPEPDLGRFVITKDEKEKGAFKTPTVRNVELTAPYMHDGSQKTLEEVVEWYDKGGHPNQWLDEKIKPLKLTAEQKADLVAFMKALTGPLPKVETGRLPK